MTALYKVMSQGYILSFLNIINGVALYIYHVYLGENIDLSDFSLLVVILSLYSIFISPFECIEKITSTYVIKLNNGLSHLNDFKLIIGKIILLILIYIFVLYCISGIVFSVTNLNRENYLYLISISFTAILSIIFYGIFQGIEKYYLYSSIKILSAVLRIAFVWIVIEIYKNNNINIILLSLLTSNVIILFILIIALKLNLNLLNINKLTLLSSKNLKILPLIIIPVINTIYIQSDNIIINKNFDTITASNFAVSSTLSKGIVYLTAGFSLIIYPYFLRNFVRNIPSHFVLYKLLIFNFVILLVCSSLIFIFADVIIQTLFSKNNYIMSSSYLQYYPLTFIPFSLMTLCENYLVAEAKYKFVKYYIILLIFQIFISYNFITSISIFMAWNFIIGTILFFILLLEIRSDKLSS